MKKIILAYMVAGALTAGCAIAPSELVCSNYEPVEAATLPRLDLHRDGVYAIAAWPSRAEDVLAEYAKLDGSLNYRFADSYSVNACVSGTFRVDDHAAFVYHMLGHSGVAVTHGEDGVVILSRAAQ